MHFDEPEADDCSKPSEMRLLQDANYLVRRARIYRLVIVHIAPAARRTGSRSRTVQHPAFSRVLRLVRLSVSSRPRAKLAHVFEAIHASRS